VASEAFGVAMNVDLQPETYSILGLKPGDELFATPRRVRVFMNEDFVI
jgi:hypothetical protein